MAITGTEETINIAGVRVAARRFNTVVVGSGAAGLGAAEHLHKHGRKDVCLVTEGLELGTSRNTGSDKQTYYRLTLCGEDGDSVRAAGRTLFGGGAMDGDIALAEAAGSAQCFYRLVDLGVPFPENAYGEFAGYKTDHDPLKRGSSCGPLTSKYMTECLLRAVEERGVEIFDKRQVIEILTGDDAGSGGKTCLGVLCLNLDSVADADGRYSLFIAKNVVYATGGEAGMYEMSVYPPEQNGSTGVALRAGIPGKNLTESQYGITSVKFRWNLSGTYQQVLPRYVSTDADGGDEREFLDSHFADAGKTLEAVFLKGYQWPFDPRKIAGGGSSLVDILVYNETALKGRRVWLDYTRNPSCAGTAGAFDPSLLTPVVREYLANSDALAATPAARLERMNPAAIELYKNHGIDLKSERLEIAVSAQHNNGGLAGDVWWQSPVAGFFPVGEVNGSHGVYRPGGSALNSGQVGGMRAARYILARAGGGAPNVADTVARCREQLEACIRFGEDALRADAPPADLAGELAAIRRRMSRHGAHIRSRDGVREALREAKEQLARIERTDPRGAGISGPEDLRAWHRLRDFAVCHFVYLSAIQDYIGKGGGSRGSYLIHDPAGTRADPSLPELFTFRLDDGAFSSTIQEILYRNSAHDGCSISWRGVRPFPEADDWFETVWRRFREGEIYA